MSVAELRAAMRIDAEYAQGFVDDFGGGYSGPAWLHRSGERPAIVWNDLDAIRAYLESKRREVS